jgi:DNA anti-recombination protein RmuC
MIDTDQQLRLVQEQLSRAEAALASLRETVRTKSEERYRLMAEAYVEQIRTLRAEIDEYLGITASGTAGRV